MHAFLIVGSTIKNREEKVSELLTSLDIAESQEVKTSKKNISDKPKKALGKRLTFLTNEPTKLLLKKLTECLCK